MPASSTFRTVVFIILSSVWLSSQAFAQVCTGAVNDVIAPPSVDGSFTSLEWSGVRPLAFKLDVGTGGLFSTCAEDSAADTWVYTVQGSSNAKLYFFYDVPALTNPNPPLGEILLGLDIPTSSGPITVHFTAGGAGGVLFDGPGLLGGVAGAATFGSSPNQSTPHFMFELAVPLATVQFSGNGVIWNASTAGPTELARFLTTFDVNDAVTAFPSLVPLAAHSLKQYVRESLTALRSSLTKRPQIDRLDSATAKLARSLHARLYLDEGHLEPDSGDRLFQLDKSAASTLLDLLRQNGLAVNVHDSLVSLTNLLVGIDQELASTAVFEFGLSGGDPAILLIANQLLTQGETDWMAGKVRAIDDYRRAWTAVSR